jgi:hypothetical protein
MSPAGGKGVPLMRRLAELFAKETAPARDSARAARMAEEPAMDHVDDAGTDNGWPRLRVSDWTETRDTLHMWMQIVGKIRMAHAPMLNHWWHATLYVTPRGLGTSRIPYGSGVFDIEFDFCDHRLHIRSSWGAAASIVLEAKSVAEFHIEVFQAMRQLGIETTIRPVPNEVDPAIPFLADDRHTAYNPGAVRLFWLQLVQADRVLSEFRSSFSGKASPVHFFWGSMDLAYTRFSGRPTSSQPGGAPNCPDWVMAEAYSHEMSSCGFWPGGGEEGAFYAYAFPEPADYADYVSEANEGRYSRADKLYLLPYENVRSAQDPGGTLSRFLHATYEAAAETAHWDRAALEIDPDRWRQQRHRWQPPKRERRALP